jgi:hypothetical protein
MLSWLELIQPLSVCHADFVCSSDFAAVGHLLAVVVVVVMLMLQAMVEPFLVEWWFAELESVKAVVAVVAAAAVQAVSLRRHRRISVGAPFAFV